MKLSCWKSPIPLFLALATLISGCSTVPQPDRSSGSVHQVGLVWLQEPGNPEARQRIIQAVHYFDREIPEVIRAVVGQTDRLESPFSDSSYDVAFILTFRDEASRQRYNAHAVHEEAARNVFLPLSRKLLFYRFTAE